MEVTAVTKYVRVSPSKARDLIQQLRGKPVAVAMGVTGLSERKAARAICKTLKSAIANAEHNSKLSVDELMVKDVIIDQGPMFKRHWPRARGMVSPILRRTSHIKIVLTDGRPANE
jgi:large subunit ribosomal protein L22